MKNILIHIPHSSLEIPEVFFSKTLVSKEEISQFDLDMCDLYVDKLVDEMQYNILKFNYSRLFCDVERFVNDDLEIMAKKGMGVVYTKDYNDKVFIKYDDEYKKNILNDYYYKHHEKLNNMCEYLLNKYNKCLIIDLHSFSDKVVLKTLNKKNNPDICLGIDYNFYDKNLEEFIVGYFKKRNYSIAINYPYNGSIVPNKYNDEKDRLISIMIEINKRIYLDDFKINEKKFIKLKKDINQLLISISNNL